MTLKQPRPSSLLIIGLSLMSLSACSTLTGKNTAETKPKTGMAPIDTSAITSASGKGPGEAGSPPVNEPASDKATALELSYHGEKIPNTTFDLPVEMNPAVAKWIAYFTGKGRERFEKYLERSEYFIPYILPILKSAKAPSDLVYLAMIESGFNNNARSNARAVGAWQFISATGRCYGLEVNWWMDERRDVEKSTIAAVQYLKELDVMFGSWHLAAAGYNAGEAKIQRAIKKYHTHDFWELSQKKFKYLRPETKNYVPKIFAAAIIGKNRKFFGFEESYVKVKSVNAAIISAKAEEEDTIEPLPDQLDTDKPEVAAETPADSKTPSTEPSVEITKNSPPDAEEVAELAPDSVEKMLRSMSAQIRTPHVNRKGEVNGDILTEVEIPSPADLFKVSSAAGLSYLEFKSMNPELLRWLTPPTNSTYRVRMPLAHKDAFVKKYFDPTFKRDVSFLVYKARRGDSPRSIAKRFGISADPVAEMNGVHSAGSAFGSGTLVQLPIPADFVRSLASLKQLDLIDPAESKRRRRHFRRRRSHTVNSSAARDSGSQSRL